MQEGGWGRDKKKERQRDIERFSVCVCASNGKWAESRHNTENDAYVRGREGERETERVCVCVHVQLLEKGHRAIILQ